MFMAISTGALPCCGSARGGDPFLCSGKRWEGGVAPQPVDFVSWNTKQKKRVGGISERFWSRIDAENSTAKR